MATKKEQIIETDFLNNQVEDKNLERKKQKELEAKQATEEGGGVTDPKGKGSNWRDKQRPCRKSLHFDEELNKKIDLLKYLEKKPVEDIIYDIVAEWFEKNFDARKKELLGQL